MEAKTNNSINLPDAMINFMLNGVITNYQLVQRNHIKHWKCVTGACGTNKERIN